MGESLHSTEIIPLQVTGPADDIYYEPFVVVKRVESSGAELPRYEEQFIGMSALRPIEQGRISELTLFVHLVLFPFHRSLQEQNLIHHEFEGASLRFFHSATRLYHSQAPSHYIGNGPGSGKTLADHARASPRTAATAHQEQVSASSAATERCTGVGH